MPPAARLFSDTMRHWFWDSYDHIVLLITYNVALFLMLLLGGYMGLNLVMTAVASAPAAVIILALFVYSMIYLPLHLSVWFAPLAYYGDLIAKEKSPSWSDLFYGLQRNFWRGLKYFFVYSLIVNILLVNLWFYIAGPAFPESLSMVSFILAGICFWGLALTLGIGLIGIPVYFRVETMSIKASAMLALRLFFRVPGFFILFWIFLASLWVIAIALKMIGVILIMFSLTAMMANAAYDVFREVEDDREREMQPKRKATSWKEKEEIEREKEIVRMGKQRYQRTVRDIFKPWDH